MFDSRAPSVPETPSECRFDSRFEIVRRLGAGGYGEVFEAIDHREDARVALKRLWHADPDAILRFKREFRVRQDIEHPNLVHVGELLEVDGEWLLTMELVVGAPWLRYVQRNPGSIAATARQVASALVALHDADLIHCDVKPSNVLVTREGRAVLLDLGLVAARASAVDTSTPNALGTAWYMAPEQAVGAAFGPPADLYALGACMYEAIAGRAPFEGEPVQVIFRKLRENPIPPSRYAPQVSPALEALCLALLAREPERRPSARELLESLDALDHGGVAGRVELPSAMILRRLPFVGRDAEIERMRSAFTRVLDGSFASVHVEADSGLGKTRLVERFFDTVERPGLLVLSGRCFDRESVPYNAFDGVFDSLADALAMLGPEHQHELVPEHAAVLTRVFPVLGSLAGFDGPADVDAVQEHVFEAALDLLSRLANRHTVVLAIDDFQWADDESITLLRRLFVERTPPAMMLVVASRTEARCRGRVRDAFDALEIGAGRHERVKLGPLSDLASAMLARTTLGTAASNDIVRRIALEARGEPLFIGELTYAYLGSEHDRAALSVEAAVHARASRLDEASTALLRLIALSAGPTADSIFAAAVGLDTTECRRRILSLRAARLVRTDRLDAVHRVEIFHDRVRAALLTGISTDDKIHLHARLARAMREFGVRGSEDLAFHLLAAGQDLEAASELVEAALRAAEGFAFDRAARLYAKAMVLGVPRAEEASCALLATLGNARANEGRPDLAAPAYLTASEMTSGAESIRLRCRAMRAFSRAADDESAVTIARGLFAEFGWPWLDGPALRRDVARRRRLSRASIAQRSHGSLAALVPVDPSAALFALAEMGAVVDARDALRFEVAATVAEVSVVKNPLRAVLANSRAIGLAARAVDHHESGMRLAIAGGMASFGVGRIDRTALDHLTRARALADRLHDPSLDVVVALCEGAAASHELQFELAARKFAHTEELLRAPGSSYTDELCWVALLAIHARMVRGDFVAAMALLDVLADRSRKRGTLRIARYAEAAFAVFGQLAANDLERAEATLASMAAEAHGPLGLEVALHALQMASRAWVSVYRGGVPSEDDLFSLGMLVDAPVLAAWPLVVTLVRFARAVLAVAMASHGGGCQEPALALARADASFLAGRPAFGAALHAGAIQAGIASLEGRKEEAIDRWLEVLASANATGHRALALGIEHRLGRLLGGANGAALVGRAEAALRVAGVHAPERFVAVMCGGA